MPRARLLCEVTPQYDRTSKRKQGRPRKATNVRALVLRMARENPRWGYTRIGS